MAGTLPLNGSSENSSAEHGYPISNFSSTLGCRMPSLPILTSSQPPLAAPASSAVRVGLAFCDAPANASVGRAR